MDYKICIKCESEFPATTEFFHKRKTGKFGLRGECKVCRNKCEREYYRNNKEKYIAAVKKWRENNKEMSAAITKKWCKENPEKVAAHDAKWRKANPEKVAIHAVKRRARELNQTPYLTEAEYQQIRDIYKKSQELGLNWHVDHVQSLSNGGLHHPDNLQIVTEGYNLQKGSKLDFRLPNNDEIFNWD